MKSTVQLAGFVLEATLDAHVDTTVYGLDDKGESMVIPTPRLVLTLVAETQDPERVRDALKALAETVPATGEVS